MSILLTAQEIKIFRKMKRWSQENLADELEVKRQTVIKWEAGHQVPSDEHISKLKRLGCVITDRTAVIDLFLPLIRGNTALFYSSPTRSEYEDRKWLVVVGSGGIPREIIVNVLKCVSDPGILELSVKMEQSDDHWSVIISPIEYMNEIAYFVSISFNLPNSVIGNGQEQFEFGYPSFDFFANDTGSDMGVRIVGLTDVKSGEITDIDITSAFCIPQPPRRRKRPGRPSQVWPPVR